MGFVYVVKRTILPSFVRFPIFMSIGFICNTLKRKSPTIAVTLFTKIKYNVFFLCVDSLYFSFTSQIGPLIVIHRVKSVCIRSYSSSYSVRMRQNTDQNNSEYGHFSRSYLH